ncbi:hypothetical protein CROQUDRAFT_655399, partial [Cronartium quercuum f. sp. fusiforme G11]
ILSQSSKWCAMCALSSLATSRYLTPVSRSHKVPREFTDHLKDLSSSLTPGVQEDAHEFLGILLNGLQNCELGINALDFTRMKESIRDKTLISRMCEARKDAVRRTELLIAPKVLVVNLQRFSFDGNKLHNPIEPSTILKLNEESTGTEVTYELQAVVCHSGVSSTSGHYYTYAKGLDGKWYLLNDHDVSLIEESVVKEDTGSYLLFYTFDK